MIDPELLRILCCPETHQELRSADAGLVDDLNRRIASGTLRNRAGHPVTGRIETGFVRADGKVLYPIRDGIPVLLADEAIAIGNESEGRR